MCQVDLILQVLVAHAIFSSVGFTVSFFEGDQVFHVDIKVHFDIYANAPVKEGAGAVDVDIRNPRFDDFGEFFSRLFVRRDADSSLMPGVRVQLETACDGTWELQSALLADFVEGVDFLGVFVSHGDSRLARRC